MFRNRRREESTAHWGCLHTDDAHGDAEIFRRMSEKFELFIRIFSFSDISTHVFWDSFCRTGLVYLRLCFYVIWHNVMALGLHVVSCCVLYFGFPCPLVSIQCLLRSSLCACLSPSVCQCFLLCASPRYLTWPPPSSLSSPVPRLVISVCVYSLCLPSCFCLFIASVPASVCVMVPC